MKKLNFPASITYIHLLLGFLFCLTVYYAFSGRVNVDEIEGIHTAWKILNGEVIYQDFFQHHHPLFYYSLIPVIKIGGETIGAFYLAEVFAFLIFAGIVVTTFLLAEKIYGDRKTSWFSVILLLTFPFFISAGTEIRPDTLQVLLGLLSVYFLAGYLSVGGGGGQVKHLVLSALLLSLSFLTLQKAVFLIFVVGLILLYCLLSGLFRDRQKSEWPKITPKITNGDFFLYWAVFSALPTLYVVFLLATGGWQNYFDFNWLVNMKYQYEYSLLDYLSRRAWILGWRTEYLVLFSLAAFSLLFMYGFTCAFKTGGTDKIGGGLQRVAVLAGGFLAVSIFFVKTPSAQYYLVPAPFVSMVAAFSLRRLFSDSAAKTSLGVFVLLSFSYLLLNTGLGSQKMNLISEVKYILSVSGPEDVYFGHRRNLFRKEADFFWFCIEAKKCVDAYRSFRDYDFDPVQIVKESRPKIIHVRSPEARMDFYTAIIEHPEVAPDYERSPEHPTIYIRKERH